MLDPSTHLCRFEANCAKIQYVVDPCPKMNRPSFCLIILKHFLMHWMVCSVYYLGWMVVNISELFAEWSITERDVTTFRYCCLGFFLAWNPLFIFRYRCCDGHFPCFGKYISPQLQTCSADCAEGSCSSNIPSNF